jgi:hypothetical protein
MTEAGIPIPESLDGSASSDGSQAGPPAGTP